MNVSRTGKGEGTGMYTEEIDSGVVEDGGVRCPREAARRWRRTVPMCRVVVSLVRGIVDYEKVSFP